MNLSLSALPLRLACHNLWILVSLSFTDLLLWFPPPCLSSLKPLAELQVKSSQWKPRIKIGKPSYTAWINNTYSPIMTKKTTVYLYCICVYAVNHHEVKLRMATFKRCHDKFKRHVGLVTLYLPLVSWLQMKSSSHSTDLGFEETWNESWTHTPQNAPKQTWCNLLNWLWISEIKPENVPVGERSPWLPISRATTICCETIILIKRYDPIWSSLFTECVLGVFRVDGKFWNAL